MESTELRHLLEECGLKCIDGRDSNLLGLLEFNGEKIPLVIACEADGMVVKLRTFELLSAPAASYRRALLSALLEINYRVKLVKFGFSPEDGEVSACIDLPLSGARLTQKQVDRCLRQMRRTLAAHLPRLREIVITGIDPGLGGGGSLDRTDVAEILEEAIRDSDRTRPAKGAGGVDMTPPDIDAILRDLLKED